MGRTSNYDPKIINALKQKDGQLTKELVKNTGIPYKRIIERFGPLEKKGIAKKSKIDDKIYLIVKDGLADKNKLKSLITRYKKAKSEKNDSLIFELQLEFEDILTKKDLRDEHIFDFIIKEAININDNTHIMRRCLGLLADNLVKAKESKLEEPRQYALGYNISNLLEKVMSTFNPLTKVIFDKKRPYIERLETLDIIRKYENSTKYDVAFSLLSTVDTVEKKYDPDEYDKRIGNVLKFSFSKDDKVNKTEFEIFEKDIEEIINDYARINPDNCKVKLWDLLEENKDMDIIRKNKISRMLEQIRARDQASNNILGSSSSWKLSYSPFSRYNKDQLSVDEIQWVKKQVSKQRNPFNTNLIDYSLTQPISNKKKSSWKL